jgi:hypothetical protein
MADHPAPRRPKPAGKVTPRDAQRWPWYYIAGPGRAAAEQSHCEHRYRITDSCPLCP